MYKFFNSLPKSSSNFSFSYIIFSLKIFEFVSSFNPESLQSIEFSSLRTSFALFLVQNIF